MLQIEILKNDLSMTDVEICDFFALLKVTFADNIHELTVSIKNNDMEKTKLHAHKLIASLNCINEFELAQKFKEMEILTLDFKNIKKIKILYKHCNTKINLIIKEILAFENSIKTFHI